MEIRGAWALVTGGAKRVGKGVVLSLARAGARIIVHHGHSPEEAAETVAEVEALGSEAVALETDLGRSDSIDSLFSRIRESCGQLDILVNSAASFTRRPLQEIGVDEFDDVMALNLRAPWLCLRHAADLMMAENRSGECGVVVNIADLTGVRSWPGYSHHGVSKAGLIHLTKIAARELAPSVRVNCVVPGAILPPPGMDSEHGEWRRKVAGVPLQRSGTPSDIGDAIVFLVRNQFMTGSVVVVDGGEHLLGGQPAEEGS